MSAATEIVRAQERGVAVRDDFSGRELMQRAELAAIAVAAQARAEIEARYIVAERRPRDWDDVRIRMLKHCTRLEFAAAAYYKIPNRGEGYTIRFAEALAQEMGNIYAPSQVIYEDDERRIVRITVTDLERNITWPVDVTVSKTVERKSMEAGRELIRERLKKDGNKVYIVAATDEELTTKQNSAISKAARTGILRLVPPDLKVECLAAIRTKSKEDSEATRKNLADGFAKLNVKPSDLKEYLGCELGVLAPTELEDLRLLFVAVRDGEITWRELMAEKRGEDESAGGGSLKNALHTAIEKKNAAKTPADTKDVAEAQKKASADKIAALPDLKDFPEPMNHDIGAIIRVKGKLFITNLDRSAWEPYAQA